MSGKTGKATFKRHEVYKIGQMIEDALTAPGIARTYKPEHSDATVAALASEALKRQLTPDDIRRVRHQVHGKLAGEGRDTGEVLSRILAAQSAQAVEIKRLQDRLFALERELTEPDPPRANGHSHNHGNGYVPPRGGHR